MSFLSMPQSEGGQGRGQQHEKPFWGGATEEPYSSVTFDPVHQPSTDGTKNHSTEQSGH